MTALLKPRVAEYMFNPAQARVPKHMGDKSGEWVDTPGKIVSDFLDRWGQSILSGPPPLKLAAPRGKQPNSDRMDMEFQALMYTTDDRVHYELNEGLRHASEPIPVTKPDWDENSAPEQGPQDLLPILDSAVRRHKTTKPCLLWRGLAVPDGFEWHPGDWVTDKAFVSLSASKDVATEFAFMRCGFPTPLSAEAVRPPVEGTPMVVGVALPKGTFLAPGSPGIDEWILPRDTVFRVVDVREGYALMEVVP